MNFTLEDETRSVSDFSPGRVEDHEHLLRIVYEPEHVRGGKLIPTAIPHNDLVERGYSTDRDKFKDEKIMRTRADAQMSRIPENRKEKFIVRFRCGDIRSIAIDSMKRDLFVVDEINDEEKPINIAHASIYSAYKKSRAEIKELKNEMINHMQNLYSFDNLFEE